MSPHEHHAKTKHAVACAIVTVSDTRTPETDASGTCIRALLEEAGHRVVGYAILPDDPGRIRAHVEELLAVPAVEAVIVNGGTGLAPRDTTYEAITGMLEKRLDGFGELFRMLSYQQVGSAAMLSRAVGGLHRGLVVFATPGSTAAVKLALERLIIPELGHLVFEAHR
jgi:molybdenum cofactor biosynthesis protein B